MKTLLLLAALLTATPAVAADVDWDLMPNGLMEITFHDFGQDRVELHRVMRWDYTILPVEALRTIAKTDHMLLFIVEYDVDRVAYFVETEPAKICYGPCGSAGWDR